MTPSLTGYLVSFGYPLLLICGIGLIRKFFFLNTETSRKLIHTLLGFTWMFLVHFFWKSWQILIVPAAFILINFLSYRFHLFRMIERDEGENHYGTIYFAVSMTALFALALAFPSTIHSTGVAVFCLCFGDGFAALFASFFKHKIFIRKDKSVQGSLFCILGSIIGLIILTLLTGTKLTLLSYLLLPVATAALELVGKGMDNLSIPFGIYALSVMLAR